MELRSIEAAPRLAELSIPSRLLVTGHLNEVGLKVVVVRLAVDHPEVLDELLDWVAIEDGGRWDKAAYDARIAAGSQA